MESAGGRVGHKQPRTSHNYGRTQSVRGVQESSGSQTATENTENSSYLFSLTLREVLMSSFLSPVEIHAAMKAALFLFLLILLSSFRPDIHYSFHLLRGRARHRYFNFSLTQMLSLLWLKSESSLSLYKFPSLLYDVQNREDIWPETHFSASLLFNIAMGLINITYYSFMYALFRILIIISFSQI